MGGDWKATTLGDVIELKRGYDLSATQRLAGNVPVVSSSGVSGSHSEYMVRGPGVVTGRYGTIGEVYYVDRDYWPLNTTLYVRDFKGANPRFVAYFLKGLDFQAYTDKAAVPGINRNDLHLAEVLWPPRDQQDRIAHILGSLDDKIELNRRMATTLEEMARALFKSWFVDFDPVRAKAEGRDHGLPAETAALFPNRFGEDGLPEGWKLGSVTDIIDVNPSLSLKAGTTAPYVNMAALPTIGSSISGYIMRDASSGSRFQRGDTLVARITPCLENGKTALVDFLDIGQVGWGSTEFIVLRPRASMSNVWPYLLARDDSFRAHLIAAMTGSSGRQRVPPSAVAAWEMGLPPPAVRSAFATVVDPIFERISALNMEAGTLRSLRDTLLPKLISGELRIKDTQAAGEAA
jgi:type I restriction enzyme, S subunit